MNSPGPAKVVPIGAAKSRSKDTLKVSIDEAGDLVLRLPGSPAFAIEGEYAERLMGQLAVLLRNARYKRLGLATERPAPAPEATTSWCQRARDGGLHNTETGRCRRRKGHKGECKDRGGSFTPATCSHIGRGRTRISNASPPYEAHTVCAHCYAVVSEP